MSKKISLLKSNRFLPLFITQFLTAFNDNVFKNALVGLITFKITSISTDKVQLLVAIAAGLFILPFFLFSAIAGQLADKFEKTTLIRITKLAEIALMMFAVFGFLYANLYILFAVLFLLGTQAAFFGPLKYSILPEQMSADELLRGNSLIEAGTFISILIGTIVGGVLITINSGLILTSVIICVVAISGWLSSRYIPNRHVKNSALRINYNFISETHHIISYVAKRKELFLCVLGISWFWFVGATYLAEIPIFVKNQLHANQNVVALFISTFCLGLAVGSIACNKILRNKIQSTYVPLGVIGISIFTMDLVWHVNSSIVTGDVLFGLVEFLSHFSSWHIIFDLFMIAFCGGIYTVPLYAMLQIKSDKSHISRVIACNNIMNALFMVASAILTIIMFKTGYNVLDVYLAVGIFNAVVAFYIMQLLPRDLVRSVLRIFLKVLFRVEVHGQENYQKAGKRAIIIANHTSFLDALIIAVFLPDDFTFAVDKAIAQRWWVKPFISLVNAYPVSPNDPMSVKSIINIVKQDKRCIIFPEGRLTRTGSLMKIYEGPGMIADKADAEIIAVRIDGAQYSLFSRMRGKVKRQLLPKITLTILPPTKICVPEDIKGAKRRYKLGKIVYDMMVGMIFETSDINKTLFASLLEARQIHGGNFNVLNDINNKPVNYRQFIMRNFVLGRALNRKLNAANVGILLPNMTTTVITFFALQAYDYVPAMLNYSSGVSNIIKACHTAKVSTVITSAQFLEKSEIDCIIRRISPSGY